MNNDYPSSHRLRSNTKDCNTIRDNTRINIDMDNIHKMNLTSIDSYYLNTNRNYYHTTYKDYSYTNLSDNIPIGNFNHTNCNLPKTSNFETTPRYKANPATQSFTNEKIMINTSNIYFKTNYY